MARHGRANTAQPCFLKGGANDAEITKEQSFFGCRDGTRTRDLLGMSQASVPAAPLCDKVSKSGPYTSSERGGPSAHPLLDDTIIAQI